MVENPAITARNSLSEGLNSAIPTVGSNFQPMTSGGLNSSQVGFSWTLHFCCGATNSCPAAISTGSSRRRWVSPSSNAQHLTQHRRSTVFTLAPKPLWPWWSHRDGLLEVFRPLKGPLDWHLNSGKCGRNPTTIPTNIMGVHRLS